MLDPPPEPPATPAPEAGPLQELYPAPPPPADVIVVEAAKDEGLPEAEVSSVEGILGADPPPPTVIGKLAAVTVIGVAPFKGEAV